MPALIWLLNAIYVQAQFTTSHTCEVTTDHYRSLNQALEPATPTTLTQSTLMLPTWRKRTGSALPNADHQRQWTDALANMLVSRFFSKVTSQISPSTKDDLQPSFITPD